MINRRKFLSLSSLAAMSVLTPGLARAAAELVESKSRTGLLYDERYLEHWLEPGHPESPDRLRAITAAIKQKGLFQQNHLVTGQIEPDEWIRTVHTDAHIKGLQAKQPDSEKIARLAVSGVLKTVQQVCSGKLRNAFCLTRPPGHHAENTGDVQGFCFYNHIAIAARYAQKTFAHKNVLIVDWDYHHGNGTETAFYTDPSVLVFSTHDLNAYPGTGHPSRKGEGEGEGYNINVHLPCGTTDAMIIKAFEDHLLPAADQIKPDLVLISAGFDSRKDDILGCYDVTDDGFAKLTGMMMDLADQYCDGRLVSILEGGYTGQGLASASVSHLQALMKG